MGFLDEGQAGTAFFEKKEAKKLPLLAVPRWSNVPRPKGAKIFCRAFF
jgi:hypothetical protein